MFVISTPLLLVALVAILAALWAIGRPAPGHFLALTIFGIYLVGVAHFVILPLRYDPELARQVFPAEGIPLERMVNLQPFFLPGADAMSSHQLLYNILVTVPFGFGLPFVLRLRLGQALVVGIAFAIGIEAAQLVANLAMLAMPMWSIDINDVLLNSAGVLIGLGLFALSSGIYSAVDPQYPFRLGPLRHFHATLMRGFSSVEA